MPEIVLPSTESTLHCDLCHQSYPIAQIALRGRMNFCQTCASARSTDCLERLQGFEKRSRWPSVVLAVACSAVGAAAALIAVFALSSHNSSVLPKPAIAGDNRPAPPPPAASVPVASPAPKIAEAKETPAPSKAPSVDPRHRIVEDAGQIHLLFVTRHGTDAAMGLTSLLFITREAPTGNSARLTTDVGSQMETSFEEGLRYVRKQPRDWEDQFSIRLSFEDKFTAKDGGSAGTGFTVAMLAATQNIELDSEVAITGDLTIDGTVQPVGAITEKLHGAIDGKCHITLIPERNSRDAEDMALLDGPSPFWQTQVFSIGTVEQALGLARKDRAENLKKAIAKFSALRARLPAVVTPNYLQSPIVQKELQEIVELAPNHLSASILLRDSQNELPHELSLNKSVEKIITTSYLFVSEVINPQESKPRYAENDNGIAAFPEREFFQCVAALQRLTPMLDRRAVELKDACVTYAGALRSSWNYKPPESNVYRTQRQFADITRREQSFIQQNRTDVDQARTRILLALRKLDTDGSLISELKQK